MGTPSVVQDTGARITDMDRVMGTAMAAEVRVMVTVAVVQDTGARITGMDRVIGTAMAAEVRVMVTVAVVQDTGARITGMDPVMVIGAFRLGRGAGRKLIWLRRPSV
jgi:hypothetical protein